MSENMQQNEDGTWVPAEPIPAPWTWKYIYWLRRLFRRMAGQPKEGDNDENQ